MLLKVDVDEGLVELDDYAIEGALQSVSIGGVMIIDSSKDDSTGISKKVMRGYDDKSISMSFVVLPNKDGGKNYEVLEKIENAFVKAENGKPVIYEIAHPHVLARGIKKLLFVDFSSSEDNGNNTLLANLQFTEFIPASWSAEKKGESSGGVKEEGKTKKTDDFKKEIESRFVDGFNSAGGS